jgi:aminopeptidase
VPGMSDHLQRLAELVVRFGSNVQPGQIAAIGTEPGKEELTRALAEEAYKAGAKFVDVASFDLHVKRARILYGNPDDLEFVPSWYGDRILALGEQRCARIGLTGPTEPGLLADLDPERVGRDTLPFLKETIKVVNDRTTNWCAAPCPTRPWAKLVHPDLEEDEAYLKLWEQIARVCRLDEDDPKAAWTARMDTLVGVAQKLTDRRFDALHFEGPGTDLRVGLLPSSIWQAARFETVEGIVHAPNIPSEEVFTAPDPQRVDGVVAATKPLALMGSIVRDLVVRFEGGRATSFDATEGGETLKAIAGRDEGAARLGEVALVDRHGRVGAEDTIFYDTLLDENAASHIALGGAYAATAGEEDHDRLNQSAIHIDFMIGSDEVSVTGLTADGDRVPVLVGGEWQL